jgi:PKD repeat protein
MNKIMLGAVLLVAIGSGCSKSSNSVSSTTPPKVVTPAPAPPARAAFVITNTVTPVNGNPTVKEARALAIQNTSENAVSYAWDFGNGNVSTDKEPSNMFLYPCMSTHDITLTVTNKDGVATTTTQSFYVACYRSVTGRSVLGTMPANWPVH